MSWQFLGVLGIVMIVAAFLEGGLAVTGVANISPAKGIAGFVALIVGGLAVLGIGYLTWRADDAAPAAAEENVIVAVVDRVMDTIDRMVSSGPGGFFSRPSLTLEPSSGPRQRPITVTGTGYQPGETVEIRIHSRVYDSPTADSEGAFSATIRIRSDAFCPSEQCTVIAQGKQSLKWIDVPYNLTE
jgi:hypothetical protein